MVNTVDSFKFTEGVFMEHDEHSLSVLELCGVLKAKTNEVVIQCNHLEDTKLDKDGDFYGSWHGVTKPSQSAEGIGGAVDILEKEQEKYCNLSYYLKVFGEVEGLKKWVESPHKSKVIDVDIVLNDTLSFKCNDTYITGKGKITTTAIDKDIIYVEGNDNIIGGLIIDGVGKGCRGINVKGERNIIEFNNISNITGDVMHGIGVMVTTNTGAIIRNNTIKNINARLNTSLGDMTGSARAILLTNTSDLSDESIIESNYCEGIYGTEGDGIQILIYDGSLPFKNANCIVRNNIIKNCNRRAIKIQGCNVIVDSNKHYNTIPLMNLPNKANLIDSLSSNNVTITNNSLDAREFMGISCKGSTSLQCQNLIVSNNNIEAGVNGTSGIWIEYYDNVVVGNNYINKGVVSIYNRGCNNVRIVKNTLNSGSGETSNGINIDVNNTNVIIDGNTLTNANRLYMILCKAPKSVITNNICYNLNGGMIRNGDSTSAGSIYTGNIGYVTSAGVILGDMTGQTVGVNYKL